MDRSTRGGPAGRITRRSRIARRTRPAVRALRRTVAAVRATRTGRRRWVTVALPAALTALALCWWLLPVDGRPAGPGALPLLLTLAGWGLGVLPVHSDRRPVRPRRRLAAQPQPARGGVEAPQLQYRAER
ncbi:hypothetical protein [Kitasatospora sp. LaBMicrA B282]|uniref:hypothetical protein n=1 Tax=Kitasatospora sp. LaBMicrA B282 TaxID=3420949 RepID=UPI003D0BDB35